MLVTFRTKSYANITMFGDVAKQLLELMEQSGAIPSAIKAEDVSAALARLESAIEQRRSTEATDAPEEDRDDDTPRKIALSERAVPLLELLRAAVASNADVMWDGA
jgi:DNA-binding NtrC family response regulator